LLDDTEFLLKVDVERGSSQLFQREKIAVLAMLSPQLFERSCCQGVRWSGVVRRRASGAGKDETETLRRGGGMVEGPCVRV
jgi:hypothetical protein